MQEQQQSDNAVLCTLDCKCKLVSAVSVYYAGFYKYVLHIQ